MVKTESELEIKAYSSLITGYAFAIFFSLILSYRISNGYIRGYIHAMVIFMQ